MADVLTDLQARADLDGLGPLNANSTEAKLAAFLKVCAGRDMIWGEHDCGIWLATWVVFWLGVEDPAEHLRGRYTTELECDDLIYPTPYPVVVGRLARRAGLRSTRAPQSGAVAVVQTPQGDIVGAIWTGRAWVMLVKHGIVRTCDPLRVVGCWEPPRCPV